MIERFEGSLSLLIREIGCESRWNGWFYKKRCNNGATRYFGKIGNDASNRVAAFDGNRTPITFDRGPKMSDYLHHNSPVERLLNGMQMHRLHVSRRLSSVRGLVASKVKLTSASDCKIARHFEIRVTVIFVR